MQGYRIGRLVLDLDRRQVLVDGRAVGLTPKSFDVLLELAKAEGNLVGREELAKLVWPDTAIEEATLRQNVYTLRTLLREADPEREYLENVPKVGYRIALPVERITNQQSPEPVALHAAGQSGGGLAGRRWVWQWSWAAAVAMLLLTTLAGAAAWNRTAATRVSAREKSRQLIQQAWRALDNRDSDRFAEISDLIEEAIRLDPQYPEAHSARAFLLMLSQSNEREALSEAAIAEKLDPASGASLAIRGFMETMYHWNWSAGGKLLEESAKRPCPDSFCRQWYGWYLAFTGELPQAVREISAAVELSPAKFAPRATYGLVLYWAGDNGAAVRELQTVVDAAGNATHARLHLWKAQLAAGNRLEASRTLILAIEPAWFRLPAEDQIRSLLDRPELFGKPEFFRRVLEGGKTMHTNNYFLAEIAMAGGDQDEALRQLERALAAHLFFVPYAKRDPLFAPLRELPRFQAIMKQVGL